MILRPAEPLRANRPIKRYGQLLAQDQLAVLRDRMADRDEVDPAGEGGFLRIPEPAASVVLFDQGKNVFGILLFKAAEIDERPFFVVVELDGGAIVHHPEPDGKGRIRHRVTLVGIDPAERSPQ